MRWHASQELVEAVDRVLNRIALLLFLPVCSLLVVEHGFPLDETWTWWLHKAELSAAALFSLMSWLRLAWSRTSWTICAATG
ncbi:MAG: hypothetical protein HC904_03045 [Blastochloris sp.]|nr:hypothetical protein [Blastochloris sp.]